MKATVTCLALFVVAVLAARSFPVAQEAGGPGLRQLNVREGFEVERIAGPPLVDRPIVADFDDEGRLYVADSSGSNDRVEKQLADRPHRIVRLEDVDGDGRFDTSVVFADRMMLPEGTMWFGGSLYVAAPPSIWKLTDTDGDGVADQREEWFRGETLTGCANDLHGPYLGPDGWIYWTKGAFAQQTYERAGRPRLVTRAAHIFRRRPSGGEIEIVMTGGMDNPVDVAFTPAGERIFTATFLEHPQAGRRDAIVHAIYGGVYGKPHNVLDGHIRTGDLMPVMCQLGPAVPAGLTRYASQAFGPGYRDTFFAAMFNLRKVTQHALAADGATFKTRDSDFLVSNDRDFHPTDVIEDADGSLLVIDTGPWYKLCCPTSQLAKPEQFGSIYRVRRRGSQKPVDPRGRRITWNDMPTDAMLRFLDDGRPSVESRALFELSRAGERAVPGLRGVLRGSPSINARRNAVWALTRIPGEAAREAVRLALVDRDSTVQGAAIHSAGLWRDRAAAPVLIQVLKSDGPATQRAAAEALGRIGDAAAVPAILEQAALVDDRVLEHSLTYALIEIDDPEAITRTDLHSLSPRARRAALIALDQVRGGQLRAEAVLAIVNSPDTLLRDTAWWLASRHPEWGDNLAILFERQLAADARPSDLRQKLAQFAGSAAVQAVLATAVEAGSRDVQRIALGAMADAAGSSSAPRLKELPGKWVNALAHALTTADDDVVSAGIGVVRALPPGSTDRSELGAALRRVAQDVRRPRDVRLAALGPTAPPVALDDELFELLQSSVSPEEPPASRTAAAAVLEKARLDRSRLLALAAVLESAAPLELPRLLAAFDQSGDADVGTAMIGALQRSKARSTIRAEVLRPRLAHYPDSVKKAGEELLASVRTDAQREARRLDELLARTQGGDVGRGQQVFNGAKGACLTCHAIGYIGGRMGPDLTKIGQVRSDRDLLEAVVFPSASFARGYEPVIVETRSGQIVSGVLRSESAEDMVLSDAAGVETRIPRDAIADVQPGTTSLMPPGFGEVLTSQELADLLAFLKAAR